METYWCESCLLRVGLDRHGRCERCQGNQVCFIEYLASFSDKLVKRYINFNNRPTRRTI